MSDINDPLLRQWCQVLEAVCFDYMGTFTFAPQKCDFVTAFTAFEIQRAFFGDLKNKQIGEIRYFFSVAEKYTSGGCHLHTLLKTDATPYDLWTYWRNRQKAMARITRLNENSIIYCVKKIVRSENQIDFKLPLMSAAKL